MHHLKSKCILKYEDRNEIEIEAFLFQIASCVKVVIFPSTSRNSQHLTFFCRNHADGFCGLLAHSNSFLKLKRGEILMKIIHNIATCLFVFMSNSEWEGIRGSGQKKWQSRSVTVTEHASDSSDYAYRLMLRGRPRSILFLGEEHFPCALMVCM